MAFGGRKWAALALAPALVLFGGAAGATEPTVSIARDLPRGIHLGDNGRYYQDKCDHALPMHCLTMRLLPETFDPEVYRREVVTAGPSDQCTCGAGNPCGGGGSSVPTGSMKPADVLAAYKVPASASANGKIVALIDLPDSTALADVNVYRKAFGIPALPQCPGNGLPNPAGGTPCYGQVDENGAVIASSAVTDCPGSDGETGLDMDMVSAACPDCSILLVMMTAAQAAGGASSVDFVLSSKVAIKLGAAATSISFGGPEYVGNDPTGHDYTTPGHLVLAASGDAGYLNAGLGGPASPSYPASAPDVLGVGGTTLSLSGQKYSEVVWHDGSFGGAGGSGCSTEFATPTFQSTFLSSHSGAFGSCGKRASVDLSAAAEFAAGFGGAIAEYNSSDQGWLASVGTSAASPMVAGILTRLGLTDTISADLGWVYTNMSAFNDITSGNNDLSGTCTSVMCKAGPGWDGPTGVGTPNGDNLAALFAAENMPEGGVADTDGGTAGGEGGTGSNDSPTTQKAGCGCRTGTSAAADGLSFLALAGVLGLAIRRRRN